MSEVTGSKARKKVYCDVCATFVSSESLLAVHNNGKKHQRLLKARSERQASAERSLYVRGFSSTGLLESDLHDYFCKFGNVSSIFVDKEKAKYAIVEYQCPTEAQTVLASKDLPLFLGKHLIIKRRSAKEPQTKKPPQSSCSRSKRLPDVEKVSHFLDEDVMHRIKGAKTFDDQMSILVSATSLTEDDNKLRRLIVQYLQEILVEVFPGCEVVPFGSSSTGLGLNGADLDLCLLVDPTYLEHLELDESEDCSFPNSITDQLQFIVRLLRQFAAGFQNVVPVVSAKCPLVKFVHRDSGLSCDLSINNRLATRNTELIKSYVALDDRIRPLAVTLKNWARAKRLSGGGGRQISNYALVLMLLHFLQRTRPAVIPVLQHIRGNEAMSSKDTAVAEKTIIDGWDCSFATRIEMEESPNQESLGDLLKEWFCYYGNTFDFGNEVISVHNGSCKRVLKHDIAENVLQTSEKPNIFKVTPLCVQDPFELSHNLTQSVPVEVLKRFIQSCMNAHSTLSQNPTETSSANSSSATSKGAFLDLFTVPTDVAAKPQKVVYSFAMPLLPSTSKHKESETTADQLQRTCEFIMDTLTRDLQVSCELQSSECATPIQNAVESSWTETSGSEGKKFGEVKHSGLNEEACQSSRKRPREEERPTERTNVKKVKHSGQSKNTSFLLHCKASIVTWQHRRRQRRLRTQSENATNDTDVDSGLTNTVENGGNRSANESTNDAMDVEETELNQTQLHKSPEKLNANSSCEHTSPSPFNKNAESDSQPLIEFTMKIGDERSLEIGKRVCGECFVVLSYLDGSIHHFANFYAFFKKYVLTKSAEHRVIKASD